MGGQGGGHVPQYCDSDCACGLFFIFHGVHGAVISATLAR
jgi:hypothetical protein